MQDSALVAVEESTTNVRGGWAAISTLTITSIYYVERFRVVLPLGPARHLGSGAGVLSLESLRQGAGAPAL